MTPLCAVLCTILAEAAVFLCFHEFRNVRFLSCSVVANFVTNITLNLSLQLFVPNFDLLSWQVFLGELIVWSVEFVFYGMIFAFSRKLLLAVCLANAITFGISFL